MHANRNKMALYMPILFNIIALAIAKKFRYDMEQEGRYTISTINRVEGGILGFIFIIAFADAGIVFGQHITLDIVDGTRIIGNFIGMKSMSYWAGIVAADYLYGLIPLFTFLLLSLMGVVMPSILYFWIFIFANFFFWF